MTRSRLIVTVLAIVAIALTSTACSWGGNADAKVDSTTSVNASPCGPTDIKVPVTASASGWNAKTDVKTNVTITLGPCEPHHDKCDKCDEHKEHKSTPAPAKKPVVAKPVAPPCNCTTPKETETSARVERRREEVVLDMPNGLDKPGLVLQAEAPPTIATNQTIPNESTTQQKKKGYGCGWGRRCR